MNIGLSKLLAAFAAANVLLASDAVTLDTSWVASRPEVLTYRTAGDAAAGLYQAAIAKNGSTIDTAIAIVSPGFMKVVSGSMALDMMPIQSDGRIFVSGQVQMETRTSYLDGKLRVATTMLPANQTLQGELEYETLVVDPAQMPFLLRALPLQPEAEFELPSLNPRTNTLTPLKAKVNGQGTVRESDCYKVDVADFEGQAVYWVEKAGRHRIMRIEQPSQHRTYELIE